MTGDGVVEFAFDLDLKENFCFGMYFAFSSSIVLDNSFNCYNEVIGQDSYLLTSALFVGW